jgi:hypothetical protein
MLKTFRLRTFLVALVLFALPLAFFASRWRRGDFEYFRRHAKLAQHYNCDAQDARRRVISDWQARHPHPGQPCPQEWKGLCPWCSGSNSAWIQKNNAYWRKAAQVAEQKFRYHRRLAGSAYLGPGGCVSL